MGALTNFLGPKDEPLVGKHVYVNVDGKSQTWGSIAAINPDGTLDVNVHDRDGRIVQGLASVKKSEGPSATAKTWWPAA
jgi:hypothetical protein